MQWSVILLKVLLCIACWDLPVCRGWPNATTRRAKRMFGGAKVDDWNVGYDAIKYYVWLGSPRSCDGPSWYLFAITPLPYLLYKWFSTGPLCRTNSEQLRCGGSLITPRIVSTACHCVADPIGERYANVWARFVLKNHYEDRMEAYMPAKLKVDLFQKRYILSEAYYMHPRCSKLIPEPKFVSYDFGWIYLSDPVDADDSPMQGLDIAYAPAYTAADLEKQYIYVTGKQAVCLVLGYGNIDAQGRASTAMKHGWVWTMDMYSCYLYSSKWQDLEGRFRFETYASWVCQRGFGDLAADTKVGDSGSPITCSNKLFGLVSAGMLSDVEMWEGRFGYEYPAKWYQWNEATSSASYMFASDHRREFEDNMKAVSEAKHTYRNTFHMWTNPPPTYDWGFYDRLYANIKKLKQYHKSLSHVSTVANFATVSVAAIMVRYAEYRAIQFGD